MPKNKHELDRRLKEAGFTLIRTNGHETWSNGEKTVFAPKKHNKKFSMFLAKRILKQAGIVE